MSILRNIPMQQQLLPVTDNAGSNIVANQIFGKINLQAPYQPVTYTHINLGDNGMNILANGMLTKSSNNSESSGLDPDYDDIMEIQDEQQSQMRYQQNVNGTTLIQIQRDLIVSTQTSSSFTEPKTIDNAILPQTIFQEQSQCDNIPKLNITKVHQTQSTTVGPVDCILDSSESTLCKTVPMQNNPANKQQFSEYDIKKSKKIQLKCQPRSTFRPRTQNESKNSSHYVRCEDGAELDYPTIYVPQTWAYQSDWNIIKVTLVDLDKQPHPYSLNNKSSTSSFADETLVVKKNEHNVLYFRLTNQDFLNGFKTFMLELIKSKQDDIITKKLIRLRKLDHSMLHFTRLYRDEFGKIHRDDDNDEYSCVMSESYGAVAVEHMGPRCGPMHGEELMFIGLKGRVIKDDLSIIISEQTTNWSHEMKKFMLNGNATYFSMPAFPYPHMNRAKATVKIYYKKNEIHESDYLYIALLDQELAELDSNDSMTTSMVANNSCHDINTGMQLMPFASSKPKRTKRLNSK